MNVPGEPLLSPVLLASSLLPPWRSATLALPHAARHADVRFFRLGRDALASAVMNLPPGPVLAPAYICREAVEGLNAAGREVRFYPLGPDMTPVWSALEGRVSAARAATGAAPANAVAAPYVLRQDQVGVGEPGPAALILVHYFGVPADASAARRWCGERDMALIEDCAHSFLSTVDGRPIGSSGDFAVFSFRKQLPVASGAALVINSVATTDGRSPGSSARFAATASRSRRGIDIGLVHCWPEKGVRTGLFPALREVAAWALFASGSDSLRRLLASGLSDEQGMRAAASGRAPGADWVTRRVIGRLSKQFGAIAERRRSNYLLLQRELSGLSRIRPLFQSLIEGAVPWGFPLRVGGGQTSRDELLAVLLHEGIGAWSWPDLPAEVTEAGHQKAWRLAHETVVLPVHQGLTAKQVQHVADTVSGWALS